MKLINNLKSYWESLTNDISKKTISDDLQNSVAEIETFIIPMFTMKPVPALLGSTVKNTTFYASKFNKGPKIDTLYNHIAKTAEMVIKNEKEINKAIEKNFATLNIKTVVDYYQMLLIRYVEALFLYSEYSRRWMNVVYFETLTDAMSKTNLSSQEKAGTLFGKKDAPVVMVISSPTFKDDAEYVNSPANIEAYVIAMNMLLKPFTEYKSEIALLEGHLYSPSEFSSVPLPSAERIDPYPIGFLPINYNPVYHIGIAINNWRLNRHERNKAEFTRFQLMVVALKQQQMDTVDPVMASDLERQIRHYSDVSNSLDAKIQRIEQRYA